MRDYTMFKRYNRATSKSRLGRSMRSQTLPRKRSKPSGKALVVLVGMPGAGKSLASSVAKQFGIPVFVSGNIIRLEAKNRNLEPTRTNLGRLMLEIRKNEETKDQLRRQTRRVLKRIRG